MIVDHHDLADGRLCGSAPAPSDANSHCYSIRGVTGQPHASKTRLKEFVTGCASEQITTGRRGMMIVMTALP